MRFILFLTLALSLTAPSAVFADDFWVEVVNETGQKIKIVGPGGVGFVDGESGPVRIVFKTETINGDTLIGWWVAAPRQLCKIYVRWGGTLIFNGETELRCRAN